MMRKEDGANWRRTSLLVLATNALENRQTRELGCRRLCAARRSWRGGVQSFGTAATRDAAAQAKAAEVAALERIVEERVLA